MGKKRLIAMDACVALVRKSRPQELLGDGGGYLCLVVSRSTRFQFIEISRPNRHPGSVRHESKLLKAVLRVCFCGCGGFVRDTVDDTNPALPEGP